MRPAVFHPKARQAIRSFPRQARRELGEAIFQIQLGNFPSMPLCRPMPVVGAGVSELRVRDSSGIFRAFLLAKYEHGVLVFHAFQKKTAKTPAYEIEVGIKRLREMLKAGNVP